ncbi:MAG: hypothetical protein CSA07_00460 [Bacteroidia bacterium]|nr:MAG: hypothetical protein CSA07_00460 [Bacteroidia bacterium]
MKVYLESRDSSAKNFWEVEVIGRVQTLRYGMAGCEGREKVKEFESEEAAVKDAEKRVAAKRREGYTDAVNLMEEPDGGASTIDCGPIPGDKLALFTPERLRRTSGFRASYWKRKVGELLRGTVYLNSTRLEPREDPVWLVPQFEAMARWELPGVEKRVDRNAEGHVVAIRYLVNGLEILVLERLDFLGNGWIDGRIRPFFTPEDEVGLPFGRKRDIVGGTHSFLSKYLAFCVEHLERVEDEATRSSKDAKVRSVAESGIGVVVQNLMEGTGYTHRLKEGKSTVMLQIDLPQGHDTRYLELSMPHKSFLKRAGDVLPTVRVVEELLARVELPFLLGNRDGAPEWGVIFREQLLDLYLRLDTEEAMAAERARIISGQDALQEAFPEVMAGMGYEWSADLFCSYYASLYSKYRSESDVYPAVLHVQMPERKVLHLLFDYTSYPQALGLIQPTVELVAQAMADAPLPFKYKTPRG